MNIIDYKDGVVCYYNKSYIKYMIFFNVDIFCLVIGWYVIYFNERFLGIIYLIDYSRFVFIDLCEVEVYGKLIFDMNYININCFILFFIVFFIIILYNIKFNLKVVLYLSMVMLI